MAATGICCAPIWRRRLAPFVVATRQAAFWRNTPRANHFACVADDPGLNHNPTETSAPIEPAIKTIKRPMMILLRIANSPEHQSTMKGHRG